MVIFKRILFILGIIFLCVLLVLSVFETVEAKCETSLNTENIEMHLEKLTENGSRSIIDKDSNGKAVEYIVSTLESYGIENRYSTDSAAYIIQDFVAEDSRGLYQNFYLKNIIVHIPASSPTPSGRAALFMAHIDSVPTSDGAADDAVAVSTMLEAIRYYSAMLSSGFESENDLVFCFVNGEEYDLFGSRAFMEEFEGLDDLTSRIDFAVNLESRGTDGSLVMFETANRSHGTLKLFSEVCDTVYACTVTDMIYNMMPNATDFSNLKTAYQGINIANIGGVENYHTQNDNKDTVNGGYASEQARLMERLMEEMAVYDLAELKGDSSPTVYFSYLDLTLVVYDHVIAVILATIGALLICVNVLLSSFYRKQNNLKKTVNAIGCIAMGTLISAGAAFVCYVAFQITAVIFGVIDIHMIGTVTYSNTSMSVALILLSLAIAVFTVRSECKDGGINHRDIVRALAYIHVTLGIILTVILPGASYLFIISGILLLLNEILITSIKKVDIASLHLELFATALHLPIILPITLLSISALGLGISYVFGAIFALTLFSAGAAIEPMMKQLSIRPLFSAIAKKRLSPSSVDGAIVLIVTALIIFLLNGTVAHNAHVNLSGNQTVLTHPYDDALIYVAGEGGETEYRIYDLNAYKQLKKYAPPMEYVSVDGKSYYRCDTDGRSTDTVILSKLSSNGLEITKATDTSIIYLTVSSDSAEGFILDDGITRRVYSPSAGTPHTVIIHSNCTLTFMGDDADIEYVEVICNYQPLDPKAVPEDEALLFNLWLTATFTLEK